MHEGKKKGKKKERYTTYAVMTETFFYKYSKIRSLSFLLARISLYLCLSPLYLSSDASEHSAS